MPVRTLVPEGGGFGGGPTSIKGTSDSEDAGLRRGVDCDVPHWMGRITNFIRVWGNLPRCVLKL